LIAFAEREAARRGFDEITLYTNAQMTENLALYPALGYMEIGRRSEYGFDRVFFRKAIRNRASE
jgi:ribosomal protein S18 acetylase RimI-like enzyme